MNKHIKLLFPCLLGFLHILIAFGLPNNFFREIIYPSWLISISNTFVSEDSILHPPAFYYLISAMTNITSLGFSLKLINIFLISLIDLILFLYIKKQFSYKLAILGMILYIPWQLYFRGNSVWFDFVTTPFVLMSFIHFHKFLSPPYSIRHLTKASIILCVGYLFKQTIVWIFITYIFWIVMLLIFKKISTSKFLTVLSILIFSLFAVILINTFFVFMITNSIIFTLQWSIIIPIFNYARLQATFLLIDQPYFKVVILLVLLVIAFIISIIKSKKYDKFQLFFLISISIASLANIFPRWSDFRMQQFLVFMIIIITYSLSVKKHLTSIYKIAHTFLITIFLGISLIVVINKVRVEWINNVKDEITEYSPAKFNELFKEKSVFAWDSPLYQGDPQNIVFNNMLDSFISLIFNPNTYYKYASNQASYSYIKSKKPDLVIIPTNVYTRQYDLNLNDETLTSLEKYLYINYHTIEKMNDTFYILEKNSK